MSASTPKASYRFRPSTLTAHRGLANATMFNNLPQLEEGDTFTIEVFGDVLTYRVLDKNTVEPEGQAR